MCRLLAYVTKDPEATGDQLRLAMLEFRKLTKTGCVPCNWTPGHQDGWGVVAYKDAAPVLYYRSVRSAAADPQYAGLTAAVHALKPETVIVHLRKTSAGSNIPVNTQPFVSDTFTLCQNGTIYMKKSAFSDTLRFFRDLVADGNGAKSFLKLQRQVIRTHQFTAMNMFFTDGRELIVAQHWNEAHPDKAEREEFPRYYTLHEMNGPRATFICSEPLKALASLKASLLPNRRFYFYRNGQRVGSPRKI